MKRIRTLGRFVSVATVMVLGFSAAAPARAQIPVSCNMTISVPGQYVLDRDLTCGSAPGLEVAANDVHINFNGHSLSGLGVGAGVFTGIGSVCTGVTGLHLNGGTVTGFDTGIELCAPDSTAMGAHVNGMTVTGNSSVGIDLLNSNSNNINGNTVAGNGGKAASLASGIRLQNSHHNTLNTNWVHDNKASDPGFAGLGFLLSSSNHNLIISNNATNNGSASNGGLGVLLLFSGGDTVRDNVLSGNGRYGVGLRGSADNIIRGNTANQNSIYGIGLLAGAENNRIQSNTAFNNGVSDLFDGNAACDSNTWKSNTFGTSNQTCIH